MPTSFTSSYLLPAIVLNPVIILHGFNTFMSHLIPPAFTASTSHCQWLESIGPLPGSTPYADVHVSDRLCWSYTFVMVFVQVLAFGQVNENRIQRKSARARKLEEGRRKTERDAAKPVSIYAKETGKANGHPISMDGTSDAKLNGAEIDHAYKGIIMVDDAEISSSNSESVDGSILFETSEEETIA